MLGRPNNYLYVWRKPNYRDTALIVAPDVDAARELWTGRPYIVMDEPDNVYELASYSRPQEMCFGAFRYHKEVPYASVDTYERGVDPLPTTKP